MSDKETNDQNLRGRAEACLAPVLRESAPEPLHLQLLQELQVHQIELEMQNQQLREVQHALEVSRDRYVDLYEFAPIGYLCLDMDGRITEINLTGATLLGVTRKELLNKRFIQRVAERDRDRWYRLRLHIMADFAGGKHNLDLLLADNDGTLIYTHIYCQRRADEKAMPLLRMAFTDITPLKVVESDLRIAATAFDAQVGIFITDVNKVIVKMNHACSEITGYSEQESIGKTPDLLKSGLHDAAFYKTMWDSIARTGAWHGEIWNRRKNGEIYPELLTISAVQDDAGELQKYVATLTDITEQKAAAAEIEHLAFYDPLTNLPNRRLLKDRLALALASSKRNRQLGALMFMDLDNFKRLNDTLGHDMGDLLLQQVAGRLLGSLRASDTAARLGGDEFVVMLETLGENAEQATIHAEVVGKKILAALSEPYLLDGHDYRCTSSIGITLFDGYSVEEDGLLKHVDIAMYQAKQSGRNAMCFFDQAMQTVLLERATLEADLRLALEGEQFKLFYQMQVAQDGRIVGAEVLIRWQHPLQGLVTPITFIPLAEETGLILLVGQWALETACMQLKRWEGDPLTQDLQLALNVSARQLHHAGFVEQVRSVLKKTGIEPSRLKLELTESMVINDIKDAIIKMQALRDIGVRFSMDDFGTGYSSLTHLTQLPFDQLKIDHSFVHNIGVKQADAVIVQTIIAMANTLGMEVIAEGVETQAQRKFLALNGCKLYQGYLFSKPVPLVAFEAQLTQLLHLPKIS